ncbi:MAG: hypothetical protein WCC87_11810 [Candidatus Korobacteraceae bacterium]
MIRKATITVLGSILGLALTADAQQMRYAPNDKRVEPGSPVEHSKRAPTRHPVRYTPGDVFVAIGSGEVEEFTPAGVLVQTLDDTTGSTYTTGMAFDTHGNLYVTNFSLGTVSEFDIDGNLVNANFISGTGQVSPESISLPGGQFPAIVGDADLHAENGDGIISEYSSTGALLNTWEVAFENRGTDWSDLQPDGHTVLYTSEGPSILSYDIATNTQNPDYFTGLPGAYSYAHRTLSSGQYSGDDLVADSSLAALVAMNGPILQMYNLPGNSGADFALNLDQNGTAFWTADLDSGEVWEVDIATGTILQQWNSGFPGTTAGLAVFQEQGHGVGPCSNQNDPNCL